MYRSLNKNTRHFCQIAWAKLLRNANRGITLFAFIACFGFKAYSVTETFTTGAFIINMGVVPQSVNNGLRPYGLIYDLIKNQDVVVKWVIGQTKIKDGTDFTYNGVAYKGGTFIIPAEYRTAAVNTILTNWQALGVVGVTTTTPMILDVTLSLRAAPNWAMDATNGAIAIRFLQRAGIPATAYYFRTPQTLNSCDDLYVMPHASPTWATHSNLYFWNKNNKGGIWGGCNAVSSMEGPGCVNPANAAQNLKFLSTGGLVQWNVHTDGTPPYNYSNYTDPVFQMMGAEDSAHLAGFEQIYLPLKAGSTWHPNVKIGCYDPTQNDIPSLSNGQAAVSLYGRAFNDTTRGYVMYQGGHDIGGTTPAFVAAQREFFNWSFMVATDKSPGVTYSNIPSTMISLQLYNNLTATPVSPVGMTVFTYKWFSSIGGTFSAQTSAVTNYTPPVVGALTNVVIYCKITDGCGRSIIEPRTISLTPAPTPPVALNDTITYTNMCNISSYTINVLSNDYDINGNMVNAISFIGGGNYGSFTNNGNGSVTYTPGWIFQGSDTMRYQVCDNTPFCSEATLVVKTSGAGVCSIIQYFSTDTVRADSVIHQSGILNPDFALGISDQSDGDNSNSAYFNNDNDSLTVRLDAAINAGDTVRIKMATDNGFCVDLLVMGSLTSNGFVPGVNSSNLTIPAGASQVYNYYDFIVTASTQYIRIKVRVTGCNNNFDVDAMYAVYSHCATAIPTALGDAISTGKNTAVTSNVRTNDSNPLGQILNTTVITAPIHGTAGINGGGNIVYTPDSGYTGTDQLVYQVCNSMCLCDSAIVNFTITDNPCSTSQIGSFYSGDASSVTSSSNVTNPNKALGVPDEVNTSNANSALISNIIGANLVLDLVDTVAALDTIIIRMSSDIASAVTIQVSGNLTNAWGSPSTTTNFNLPAAAKTYVNYNFIVSAPTRYIRLYQNTTNATVDVDAASFNFWQCSAIPNRPPVSMNDTITIYANQTTSMDVTANDGDPDGNTLSVSIIAPAAAHGSPSVSGNNIVYAPDFGYTGVDTVTYMICDNGTPSLCDTSYFIITTIPGPPVAVTDYSSTNSNVFVTVNVQANDTLAVNGYTYTTSLYPAILSPSNGSAILIGNSIKYTPNANFTGVDSLAYELCDNGSPAACDTSILYITVNNQLPTANANADTTSACNSVILDVLANDTDPENGVLTLSSVSVPSSGTAVISNNQIVYTPVISPVFTGTANFTYQVCDNGYPQQCSTGNVTVTVNAVSPPSNPPNAVNDIDTSYINQNFVFSVLNNDTDPDLDSLEVDSTAVGLQAPTKGTIHYQPNGQILYTPFHNAQGVDSFQYKVCDIHHFAGGCVNIVSSCSIAKAYLTIINRKPSANDDSISTLNTVTVSGNVAVNDYEPDGQPMTFAVISGTGSGVLVFNSNGSYTFTPDGVFIGTLHATYIVCDGASPNLCDTAILTINTDMTNVPPNPATDTIVTYGITPYNGDVSTNDMDPNGNMDPNGFTLTTFPNNGTILFNTDGSFNYTAYNGFVGTDYAFYEVCDLASPKLCWSAMIVIIVPDSAPVTFNENNTVNEDNVLNVAAGTGILSNGDFDPNGTVLTLDTIPLINPSNGVVIVQSTGAFTYTPSLNFNGPDYFVVSICDSTPLCTADTVFITVNPVNDPPVIINDSISINEDSVTTGTIITSDYDPDSTTLVIDTIPLSGPNHGTFTIDSTGTFTYIPDPDFNGSDTIIINICDTGNPLPVICVSDTLIFNLTAVNDTPIIANDNNSTNEDTPLNGTIITAGDFDPDSTTLIVNTTPVSGPAHGGIVINAAGNYTYTPSADYNGTDMVIFSVCDSGNPLPAICVNDTLFLVVNAVNDSPVIVNDSISINEDSIITGTIITSDFDPDSTTLVVDTIPLSGPNHGTISIDSTGTFIYTPDPDFNGADTVIISICDTGNPSPVICVSDTLIFNFTAVNDPPVLANDTANTNEITLVGGNILTAGDFDPDTSLLTATTVPVYGPSHGVFNIDSAGNYTYTPNLYFNGSDTIVISVCDSGTPLPSMCGYDTLFITVNGVNSSPIITNDSAITIEDNSVSGTVITGADWDPEGMPFTADTIPISGPSHGSIVINSDGTYTYTPALNYNGTDFVVISVCDVGTPPPDICINDTLYITITPVNDTVIITNDNVSTNEDIPASGNIITAGDYDADTTVITVTAVPVSGPYHGMIVIDNAGNYTYTPSQDFNGVDTVIFNICDAGTPLPATCVNDTLFIIVNPVNDIPVVNNENSSVCSGSSVQASVLINDSDIDPDTLAISSLIQPADGTASTNGTTIIYTPDPGFIGSDSIIYNVCDNGSPQLCAQGILYITVNGINGTAITSSEVLCTGDSSGSVMTTPSGNAPFSFIWSNGAVTQNIINVPAGTYTVTITDSLGCSLVDSAVISEPNSAIAVSGSITDVKCFGDSTGSIILAVSGGTAPYNYLWTNGDTTKDLLNAPAASYSATITDAHGCTQTVSQPVSQPSAAISISGVSTPASCLGGIQGAIDVTVNGGTPGYTYNWSSGSAAQDISSMPSTYTIVVTDSNSCIDSASYTITDNSTLTINSSGAVSFCSGDSTVLSSSASGGVFQWLQNGIAIPGGTNSTLSVTLSGTYSLSQINSCGTYTSNSIVVSVIPNPVLSVSGTQIICENQTAQLTVSGASNYNWTPSSSLDNDTSSSPAASPQITTTYTVTGTSQGCSSYKTIIVIVNPIPVITVTASPHDCKNGSQLNVSGAVGYIWQPAIGLDTINIPNPMASPESTTTYTVTAFSSNFCSSTASVTVIVDCNKLIIPSGFSPNNDGVNDRFVIDGIEDFPMNSFQVFNRWGNIIYSKDNYDNSWDGTLSKNGLKLGDGKVPNGTYFYTLNLGEAEQSKSGYIIVKY